MNKFLNKEVCINPKTSNVCGYHPVYGIVQEIDANGVVFKITQNVHEDEDCPPKILQYQTGDLVFITFASGLGFRLRRDGESPR